MLKEIMARIAGIVVIIIIAIIVKFCIKKEFQTIQTSKDLYGNGVE